MRKIILVGLMAVMTTACSHNMNAIETINAGRSLSSLSKAGMAESSANCIKDLFDTANRGSGCHRSY
tara:strand:- start:1038 stop:1238 length:201 start_codon:yes stop_codon:yes gene_type:complete